jgi:hypothetical protein
VLFDEVEATLLQIAATLHDIGYSQRIRRTGFHPMDGAEFLRSEGYPEALVRLVANHSLAEFTAGEHRHDLIARFPATPGLLADALTFADMHSAPDGRLIQVEHRLADIQARHRNPAQARRAIALRSAIARVEHSLATGRSLGAPASTGRPAAGSAPPEVEVRSA